MRHWFPGTKFLVLALLALASSAALAGESLSGRLLVATPELSDPNFARTVVFMIEHSPGGALGLVVNAPMGEVPLDRLLERAQDNGSAAPEPVPGDARVLVRYGGPVRPDLPFILHSPDVLPPSSRALGAAVALSHDPALLAEATAGRGPVHVMVMLGYAGWAPGQLDAEIGRGDWYIMDWNEGLVFGGNDAGKWDRAVALAGPEL